jgi:hypothetical protein
MRPRVPSATQKVSSFVTIPTKGAIMQDILTWGALVAAGGSLIAIITFWMNRGKAEAEACAKADAASGAAHAALAKADQVASELVDARIAFASEYARQRDLVASETRFATAFDGLRTELRGTNDRLDRILERFAHQHVAAA